MEPQFFEHKDALRKWFLKHHETAAELLLGYHRVATGRPSVTWSDSVDVALCFGWIDGVRKPIDNLTYTIRFTRRRPTSIWSRVNINKVAKLTEAGLMLPEGIAAFEKRKEEKSAIYAFEKEAMELSAVYTKQFKKQRAAWNFFIAQAPYYKKVMIHRVMTAKQEATRQRRLDDLIRLSSESKRAF